MLSSGRRRTVRVVSTRSRALLPFRLFIRSFRQKLNLRVDNLETTDKSEHASDGCIRAQSPC